MRVLLLLTGALLTAALSTGCSTGVRRPFLWTLEKDGKTSYLFGSQHLGVPYTDLPGIVFDKLEASEAAYTEVDPTARDRIATNMAALIMRKPSEPPAPEILTPKAWAFVVQKLAGRANEASLRRLTPFGLHGLLMELPENKVMVDRLTANQWDPLWSIDKKLDSLARGWGKKTGALDSADLALEIRECMVDLSREAIEDLASGKPGRSFDELWSSDYRSGDAAAVVADLRLSPSQERCLLVDRNLKWVPRIEEAHRNYASTFFTVGVAHLIYGKQNLVALLEKRGFRLTRIKAP
jgi:uncharacterized protein YbaP (TraB family)